MIPAIVFKDGQGLGVLLDNARLKSFLAFRFQCRSSAIALCNGAGHSFERLRAGARAGSGRHWAWCWAMRPPARSWGPA